MIFNSYSENKKYFSNNTNLVLVFIALLIATAYRIYGLDRLSLWADELWGVMSCSRGSWAAMMHDLAVNDNHPPGYQTILYFVMKSFGDTETIIRMPSVIAGILVVIAIYHIGKKLFSVEAGIIAAFIVAGSYQSIYYSQEARAYTLLALFCTLNGYYFIKLFVIEDTNNTNTLLFLVTGLTSAILHYAGLVFIGCELILASALVVFVKNKKNMLVAAAYTYGIIAMLYMKWIPVMISQMQRDDFYWEQAPDIYSIFSTFKYLLGPDNFRASIYGVLIVGTICFSSFQVQRGKLKQNKIILVVFALLLMPLVAVMIKSLLFSSIYTNRYFIFIIPFASLIGAYGITSVIEPLSSPLLKKAVFILILVSICLSSFAFNRNLYTDSFGKHDFRGAAAIVAADPEFISERGAIVASHEFFKYYLKRFNISERVLGYLMIQSQYQMTTTRIDRSKLKIIYYLEAADEEKTLINSQLDLRYRRMSYLRLEGINVIKYKIDSI